MKKDFSGRNGQKSSHVIGIRLKMTVTSQTDVKTVRVKRMMFVRVRQPKRHAFSVRQILVHVRVRDGVAMIRFEYF